MFVYCNQYIIKTLVVIILKRTFEGSYIKSLYIGIIIFRENMYCRIYIATYLYIFRHRTYDRQRNRLRIEQLLCILNNTLPLPGTNMQYTAYSCIFFAYLISLLCPLQSKLTSIEICEGAEQLHFYILVSCLWEFSNMIENLLPF